MDLFWAKARRQRDSDLILLKRIKNRSLKERSTSLPKSLSSHAEYFHRDWRRFLNRLEAEEPVSDNLFIIPSAEVPEGTESYKIFLDDSEEDYWVNGGEPPEFGKETKGRVLEGKSYVGPKGFKTYLSQTSFNGSHFEEALSSSLSSLMVDDSLWALSEWKDHWREASLTLIGRTNLDFISERLTRSLINRINKAQSEINKLELKLAGCDYIIKGMDKTFPIFKSLKEGYESFQYAKPKARSIDYETFLMPVLSTGPLTNPSS
jgi:hypothetical protein